MLKPEASWGGMINMIMYPTIFAPSLMPVIDRVMSTMSLNFSREDWITAIDSALTSGYPLVSDTWQQHSDADIRQFLAEISQRLAAGKPYGGHRGSVHS